MYVHTFLQFYYLTPLTGARPVKGKEMIHFSSLLAWRVEVNLSVVWQKCLWFDRIPEDKPQDTHTHTQSRHTRLWMWGIRVEETATQLLLIVQQHVSWSNLRLAGVWTLQFMHVMFSWYWNETAHFLDRCPLRKGDKEQSELRLQNDQHPLAWTHIRLSLIWPQSMILHGGYSLSCRDCWDEFSNQTLSHIWRGQKEDTHRVTNV